MFLTGHSPDEERRSAKDSLVSGKVRFIFVVDIYNEGVDIPEVNTVLFLRPTESLTIFLQQLGRGLRLAEDKECLTVLDFIGQANRKYNFEDKFQMFYITVWGKAAEDWSSDEVWDNLYALADSPVMLSELIDLLRYQYDRIDFIDAPVDVGFDCPLDLHCTYTRDQLLVALDFLKPATVREGVKWLPDQKLDVFFVTMNKSDKDYSPTTMYNDYSINEWLFHWQSQSTTAENSPTGQRWFNNFLITSGQTGEVCF